MTIERPKFSTEIEPTQVSSILNKNYVHLMTEYFELQRIWISRAYSTFQDLDKYFILITLIKNTLDGYSNYMVKYNFEQFYSVNHYELKKFNIVTIAKELSISKETARRKLIELEKIGLIKKEKKAVTIHRDAYQMQRPIKDIVSVSRFMSTFSKKLTEEKITNTFIDTEEFTQLIKKNFSLCWKFFLEFQIEYVTDFKEKFFDDYETFAVWAMIIYNQNLALNKKIKGEKNWYSMYKDPYFEQMLSLTGSYGLNAMTISDLTGIPRPTVIRKLNKLVKAKFTSKDNNGLYSFIKSDKTEKVNKLRLKNVTRISNMVCKFFNAARMIKNDSFRRMQ